MKKVISIIIFISILLIGNSLANNHYPITTESKIMIAKGKISYEIHCASCHKVNLAGADNWKGLDQDGHRKAPPLNGAGHAWHHDDVTLHSITKYGLAKLVKNYQGKMIGFGDKLSDEEIDNVLAYIKSYWPKDEYEYQIDLNK